MTDQEYDAMLFCAASAAIERLPDLICQMIRIAGYQIPADNLLDDAITRAIYSRSTPDVLTIIEHEGSA